MGAMDPTVESAYSELVPKDQLVVDAMIAALYEKDVKIRSMIASVHELIDERKKE